MSDDFVDRRSKKGLWVHWIGDAVSLAVMLGTFLIGYGELRADNRARDDRIVKLEASAATAKQDATAERRELKNDIQNQLQNIIYSISALDNKVTAVMLDQQRQRR